MPTSTPARRRDAEANRLALLDATARLIATDPDASLEAIAAEAGLTRRAVYGHYATRDDLLAATFARGAERIALIADGIRVDHPAIALAELGARLWDAVEPVRVGANLALRSTHAPQVAAALEPVRALLSRILEAGADDGSLRSDIPVRLLAPLVERAAVAVLGEATAAGLAPAEGHRLVMLIALSTAGLSAAEAEALIASSSRLRHPSPVEEASR